MAGGHVGLFFPDLAGEDVDFQGEFVQVFGELVDFGVVGAALDAQQVDIGRDLLKFLVNGHGAFRSTEKKANYIVTAAYAPRRLTSMLSRLIF